jgi:DNA-directed RNA polymerase subunit beta'
MYKGTLGQFLVKDALPTKYQPQGNNFTVKDVKTSLMALAKDDPTKYAVVAPSIKRIGDEFSTYEGLSVGLDDIEPEYKKRDPILKAARRQIMSATTDTQINKILINTQAKIKAITKTHPGDMALTANAGAKGNINQLMKAVGSPVVIGDAKGKPTPYLIERGYSEGLSPAEAWIGAVEARANGITAATSVSGPGEMQKVMANMMSPLVVSGTDCGTHNGILLDPSTDSIEGRYLAGSNKYVDSSMYRSLSSKGKQVKVRSALTCEADGGICQKCAGRDNYGKNMDIGVNVGIRSSQALSEPLTQMTLSARHGVNLVAGSENDLKLSGLKGFKQLVEMPNSFMHKAPLAESGGKVESISKAPQGGFDIKIGGRDHYVPPKRGLKIKLNQKIEPGDVLSTGIPNPADVIRHKGIGEGRKYLAGALQTLYKDEGIRADPKHFEYLAKTQFDYVKADKRLGEYLPGEVIPYNTAKKLLSDSHELVKPRDSVGMVLKEPILHHMPGTKITRSMLPDLSSAGKPKIKAANEDIKFSPVASSAVRTPLYNPNWMQRLGFRYQKSTLLQAAATGEKADIHSYNPVPGIVTGEIGRSFDGKY